MIGIKRALESFITIVSVSLLAFPAYAHHETSIPTGFESFIILSLLSGTAWLVYRQLFKNRGQRHNR